MAHLNDEKINSFEMKKNLNYNTKFWEYENIHNRQLGYKRKLKVKSHFHITTYV